MIYFVQGTITGNIKIGFTGRDFLERFNLIQSSDVLVCLNTTEGDQTIERELHNRFYKSHDHQEWFKPSPELLSYIDSLPPSEFTGIRQGQYPNAKRSASTAATRAANMALEAHYLAMGVAAFKAGAMLKEAVGEGVKLSTVWYRTRNMWKWGWEQARAGTKI